MTNKYDKMLDETCLETVHPSGLLIRIVKKPGKSRKTAMIATRFGSINREFEWNGAFRTVPNGTAHFLEHKLFEGKNGGAFDYYAKTGAKANAYTSTDKTAYYFVCTDKFEQNLDILLSFVSNPYLTDENVAKEKGIIGQEIKMYEDDPTWQGYFGLIRCLYGTHPVKYDIAGSTDDIAPLDVETLMSCYNTFYQPSNMVLAVCGDIDENAVLAAVDKYFPPREPKTINQRVASEPRGVVRERFEKIMPVSRPIFYIGFKDNDVAGDLARREIETAMLLQILFGASTPFYKELYDSGVIDAEFDTEFELSDTYAFVLISGESDEPDRVLARVKDRISEFLENGVSTEEFTRVRNTIYGELVSSLDNVSGVASMLMTSGLARREPFDAASVLSAVTPADIEARGRALFADPDAAMSVIKGE